MLKNAIIRTNDRTRGNLLASLQRGVKTTHKRKTAAAPWRLMNAERERTAAAAILIRGSCIRPA